MSFINVENISILTISIQLLIFVPFLKKLSREKRVNGHFKPMQISELNWPPWWTLFKQFYFPSKNLKFIIKYFRKFSIKPTKNTQRISLRSHCTLNTRVVSNFSSSLVTKRYQKNFFLLTKDRLKLISHVTLRQL